jgi:hypothetical protein
MMETSVEREPGRRFAITMLVIVVALVVLFGLAVWAVVRGLSDPLQTQASNEVLDVIEPADLKELGRGSEGNGGYTLFRTYELGNLAPRGVVEPPDGFEPQDEADSVDGRHWNTILSWAGPSPKGEGDCVIRVAVSHSKNIRPRLLRLTVSCLALEVPGV